MKVKNIFSAVIAIITMVVAFNSSANAQASYYKGYVVLLTGDTLKGEIKMNAKRELDNFTKATYRKSEGSEIKTFNPKKIKEYNVNGVTFVSRNLEDEQVFLKQLSGGLVNLYEEQVEVYQMNEIKVKSDYYMEKAGEAGPIKIKSGKFKKQVEEVMADNSDIVRGLEDKTYDFDNIVEVFNSYNKSGKN